MTRVDGFGDARIKLDLPFTIFYFLFSIAD